MHLVNKKILLGVSGGIAAYKSADLVRRLREAGAVVRVVMTASAQAFVTPLTFQAVSGLPVHTDLLDSQAEAAMGHIELAKWADMIVIAPATADIMAKLTHGLADNLLLTLCLASAAPLIVVPAMNQQMWLAHATQHNVRTLRQRGVALLGPAEGNQACGDSGPGRMLEPMEIVASITRLLLPACSFQDVNILITAGPTQEALDPVRYISNHSSGKMGYALAQAAVQAGAKVTLISGPVNLPAPSGLQRITVTTAEEMQAAVMAHMHECAIFIAAAAVADYRPEEKSNQKIKKSAATSVLKLVRTPDILAAVSALAVRPFCVGFAAETHDIERYAEEKLHHKKLDMIAANQVGNNLGFGVDQNALTVIWKDGRQTIAFADKVVVAQELLNIIARIALQHSS